MAKEGKYVTVVCQCGKEFIIPDDLKELKGINPFWEHKNETRHEMEFCFWKGKMMSERGNELLQKGVGTMIAGKGS